MRGMAISVLVSVFVFFSSSGHLGDIDTLTSNCPQEKEVQGFGKMKIFHASNLHIHDSII